MKFNIVFVLLVVGCIFVAQTNGANIRAATGNSFSEGYTLRPSDIPLSDIESPADNLDADGCKKSVNCSKASQEAALLKSSDDCQGDCNNKTGMTGMTGVEDETGVEVDPLPPVHIKNRTKHNATNSSRMDMLLKLESEVDGQDNQTKNATNATSFKPCPEITSGCGECLANPACGFCRSTKKCMFGAADGPNQNDATCPGRDSWNFAECEAPSCASITNCSTCIEAKICGWCPGKGCVEGGSYGPVLGSCDRWINAPNGTCPRKLPTNFTMLMEPKYNKTEGSEEVVNATGNIEEEDDDSFDKKQPDETSTGEPSLEDQANALHDAVIRTSKHQEAKPVVKPITIEQEAENVTKFHKMIKADIKNKTLREKEFAKVKFSEKRAYTVVPEIIVKGSSSLKNNNVEKPKKWITIDTSFVEVNEARRGQGIIEAASCVCNGKCEKPMEDAVNCPCDCAAKKKKMVQPAKPTVAMIGPKNEKNLPELTPESTVGGGVVANLRMTSDNDELNETKVAIDQL